MPGTSGREVRWGVAGTGAMARAFVDDLRHVPRARVVAVGSRDRSRAESFAAECGDSSSDAVGMTHAELVAADLDVLYVATPHAQHRDVALAAIDHGVPVLVEKAFTATLAGAREVVEAARARQVFCMEAMWTRFQPAVVRARDLVAAGEIGEVVAVHADLGGGAVLDLGVYVISLAQHFLGAPDLVTARGTLFPNGAEASATIALGWDDGRGATLATSLTSPTSCRAVLMGTSGSIELGPEFHHPHALVVRRAGEPAEEVHLPPTGSGYSHEAEHVHACLDDGLLESPVVPLADTLAVQAVMQEVLEQLGRRPQEGSVAGLSS